MKVIKCKNGDWYDADEFSVCPHCGADPACEWRETTTERRKKPWSFIGGRKEKTASSGTVSEQRGTCAGEQNHNYHSESRENGVTEAKMANVAPADNAKDKQASNPTLDFWQNESGSADEKLTPDSQEYRRQEDAASLRDVVRKATANSEGKTMSYFNTVTKADSGYAKAQTAPSFELAVGWLVCIGGKSFGRCYEIYAEKNSIGRSEENRIVISEDDGISRVKHAFIIYEPKKRNFYLQPGDGSGLTYLNDEYITDSKKLKSHDIIELGGSKLMFVPLCSESFSWENYILKEE